MGGRIPDAFLLGITKVNLSRFHYLSADSAVLSLNPEWSTSGLVLIFHHTAYPERTIKGIQNKFIFSFIARRLKI